MSSNPLLAIAELRQPTHDLLVTLEFQAAHDPLVHAVRGRHGNAAEDVANIPAKRRWVTHPALLRRAGAPLGFDGHRRYADERDYGAEGEADS